MERIEQKDSRRQLQGQRSRAMGKLFEDRLDESFAYYKATGFAAIEKTPEPMKILRRLENGRFIACFQKKAQADYQGTVKGGRTWIFEAKFTANERMMQSRVEKNQADYLDSRQALGARCFVIAGFSSGEVYRVPWDVWKNMKAHFGRKYVTEEALAKYRVGASWNNVLLLLG